MRTKDSAALAAGSCLTQWTDCPIHAEPVHGGGCCGPDGGTDIFDIFAVLDAFLGTFADECEEHNLDIASSAGCVSDGDVNIFDIFAILDAFQDIDPCCS